MRRRITALLTAAGILLGTGVGLAHATDTDDADTDTGAWPTMCC